MRERIKMALMKSLLRKALGIREFLALVAALSLGPKAAASLAPELSRIGTIEALNAAGSGEAIADGQKLLPLRFDGMPRASYFLVDPSAKTLLVSREFIAENNLWEYKFEREILLPQASGGLVAGDLVRFYVLTVGSRALHDVEAVICDECGETAGTSLLDNLN
jgi:hypothetical protein